MNTCCGLETSSEWDGGDAAGAPGGGARRPGDGVTGPAHVNVSEFWVEPVLLFTSERQTDAPRSLEGSLDSENQPDPGPGARKPAHTGGQIHATS